MYFPPATLTQIEQTDRFWHRYRQGVEVKPVITEADTVLVEVQADVIIAGGTLGILVGCALQRRGFAVTIVEKGVLRGRDQEWNISRSELSNLLEWEILTAAELSQVIVTEYNPGRIGFHQGIELWVTDVLNIGVSPFLLINILRQKFVEAGGQIIEHTSFVLGTVCANGIEVQLENQTRCTGKLLLDCMGHFSPIALQARQNLFGSPTPDGICQVIGGCATGLPPQQTGDLLYTFTPVVNQNQYFWEAFPAQDGRTTYLFTYSDLHPDRPSFAHLFEAYLQLLPHYQQVEPQQIQFKRILSGFFPSYRRSPLPAAWPRVLSIGDSSGQQSPLSFGGFGAMVRHLPRLINGLTECLRGNYLSRSELGLLQPYQPNIAVTWLFQQVMRVDRSSAQDPNFVNRLLSQVFQSMAQGGEAVLQPFLQDVIQFPALSQTMVRMAAADPLLIAQVISQVGLGALGGWTYHFGQLGLYELLYQLRVTSGASGFSQRRRGEAWSFGAGRDVLYPFP